MKQASTLLSTIVILLAMLTLHTSNVSAKLYMGKITMQVGETREVEAVPPISAYTASGSFSKTGTCVAITANGSYTCKIKANYVGTGTLSYWGSVARSNTWTTEIYDLYWDVEVKVNSESSDSDPNPDPIETNYVFNDGIGVKDVCNSVFHTLIVKEDGTLWTCGANDAGQLGDGTKVSKSSPSFIMDNVSSIAVGTGPSSKSTSSFAVKTDGSLYGWGDNSWGQLGDGSRKAKESPVKIMDGVSSVYAGSMQTFIIKSDGSLLGCGSNSSGSLGDGTETDRNSPVKILDNVFTVCIGGYDNLAIKKDGSLWAWGKNEKGEVGNGTRNKQLTPVKIMENVVSVAEGNDHFMALKGDGTLWIWGTNKYGLGDGSSMERLSPMKIANDVVSISSGSVHCLFVKRDGSLWAFGSNGHGQLGDGTTTNRKSAVKVLENVAYITNGPIWTIAVKEDGTIWTWGDNSDYTLGDDTDYSYNSYPTKIQVEGAKYVKTNRGCTFIVLEDKSLWGYGNNYYGALGDGTSQKRYSPVSVLNTIKGSTAIEDVVMDDIENDASIYNLSGQRLDKPRKGINIIGGKKVMVK